MKKFLVLTLFLLSSAVSLGQPALTPGASPAIVYRLRSITYSKKPSSLILVTLYNATDASNTQSITVSYPCDPADCATNDETTTAALIVTWFTKNYTGAGNDLETVVLTKILADFDVLAGMSCCD